MKFVYAIAVIFLLVGCLEAQAGCVIVDLGGGTTMVDCDPEPISLCTDLGGGMTLCQ